MNEKFRELLGLTKNEIKVYNVLLSSPYADSLELSQITKLPRTRIYELLSKLASKHLLDKTSTGYRVLPPEDAIEEIQNNLRNNTTNKISALDELSIHLNKIWKEGATEMIQPGVSIFSFQDIEHSYLKELNNIQKRVFIAASNSSGGIDWKSSGEALAKSYSDKLDIRYLYSDKVMAERMIHAFKHYVPFNNLNIKIKSNPELTSSFILIDQSLYIFFMGTDTYQTKVLSVISTQLVLTFEWLFLKLWDEASGDPQ